MNVVIHVILVCDLLDAGVVLDDEQGVKHDGTVFRNRRPGCVVDFR